MAKSKTVPFDQLLTQLESGKLQLVYVLYGEERYLIERAISLIKGHIVDPDDDLAYTALRAGEASGKTIVSTARTVPMLSERQLVVVRQVEVLGSDDLALLLKYFEKPVESTCLVLVASKVSRVFKAWKRAAALGYLFDASSLKEYQIAQWIRSRAGTHGLRLSAQASQFLADSTGSNLSAVEDALERLALYVGPDAEATGRDVEAVVASSRVRSIFELTDALGRRDAAGALRTLTNMLSNQEAPLRLLATLATHLRRLLMAAELGREVAGSPGRLASRLKIHPYAAEKISIQVRSFTVLELRTALARVAETDIELKSSRRPDELIMEETILDLCLGRKGL